MRRAPLPVVVLLAAALLAGCTEQVEVVAPIRLDVQACLVPAAGGGGDRICGESLKERSLDGLFACLAYRVGQSDRPAIPYRLRSGMLEPVRSVAVDIDPSKPIVFRLFFLQPGAGEQACTAYRVDTPCDEADAGTPESCLLSFRPDETRLSGGSTVSIVYGNEENPCGIECNDRCAPGDGSCRRLCWNERHPVAELCNGVDDDCDGEVDEGHGVGEPCDGRGECGAGTRECLCLRPAAGCPADDARDGRWQQVVCSSEPPGSADEARPEQCNGRDDDCDGETDEDWQQLGEACTLPGECGRGQLICTAGG
ncbi:MAG: hypothetical protein FJ125_18380, partial [Deltaproteobacteria bacterium]|nr:hypothetical protein [Deltaproteobacteria bacterium]